MQNVQSLPLHINDVLCDPIKMASNIICLTETSLKSKDWAGWSQFNDFSIYQVCRNEKQKTHKKKKKKKKTHNENQKGSGGVALLIRNSFLSRADESMSYDSFEMVTAVLNTHADDSDNFVVSALYKDHAIKKSDFLDGMKAVFEILRRPYGLR